MVFSNIKVPVFIFLEENLEWNFPLSLSVAKFGRKGSGPMAILLESVSH